VIFLLGVVLVSDKIAYHGTIALLNYVFKKPAP
jgi:hypothetical protein